MEGRQAVGAGGSQLLLERSDSNQTNRAESIDGGGNRLTLPAKAAAPPVSKFLSFGVFIMTLPTPLSTPFPVFCTNRKLLLYTLLGSTSEADRPPAWSTHAGDDDEDPMGSGQKRGNKVAPHGWLRVRWAHRSLRAKVTAGCAPAGGQRGPQSFESYDRPAGSTDRVEPLNDNVRGI